jgi:hypothetical protein
MKFMMTYEIGPEGWDRAVKRFLDTGGLPPAGVKMLGRWNSAAGRYGFILLEGNDPSAIYRFSAEWNDVCNLRVTPVIEDEEAAKVLGSLKKKKK